MKITLFVLSVLSMAGYAHADECGSHASVAAARTAENRCIAISNLSAKQDCLDELTDWWFHCGGALVTYNPYLEMTRIFKIQLQLSPTRLDTISNLAYYTFSIEDDAILEGTLPDFTSAPADAYLNLESHNSGDLDFYTSALAVPALIVTNSSPAKTASRVAYYANLKRNYVKACVLVKSQLNPASACEQWITTAPVSGPCGSIVAQNELSVCVAGKILLRYQQYDHANAL